MSAVFRTLAVLALATLGVLSSTEAAAQVTANNIASAILGQGSLPLAEVDITADGVVDARDLACFHSDCNPPSVEFTLGTSDRNEGAGVVQLQLTLSRSAFCTLNYSVDGPATPGFDYATPTGTITLAGPSATIPITLLDDSSLDEELEPLIVSIGTGSCYQPGAQSVHTLNLVDNDRVWFGTLEAYVAGSSPPTLSGDLLGFQLNVVHTNSGDTVTMVSDGAGTLPVGSWGALTYNLGASTFAMSIAPVSTAAATTSFVATLQRSLAFTANAATPGHVVQPTLIRGAYSEAISTNPASHLQTTVTGLFTLIQGVPKPSSWTPPLDPSP